LTTLDAKEMLYSVVNFYFTDGSIQHIRSSDRIFPLENLIQGAIIGEFIPFFTVVDMEDLW
jgi:hypothetical protein